MDQAVRTAATGACRALPELYDALLAQRGGTFHDDVALLAARIEA